MPRENAHSQDQDPGLAAGLDRAGEGCDGKQVTFAGVRAAPGLLQELPRHDVSRAWGFCDPRLPFVILLVRTSAHYNIFSGKEQDVLIVKLRSLVQCII